MAKSDQGNDVFLECIEGTPLETSQTPGSEQPETHRSSPATVSGESTNGLDSPQTARDQTIEEKHQAALAEYENKHYVACRDKCMELLRDGNLPSITRCQILQLFASCSYYYGAKHALEQALIIASNLENLDPSHVLQKDVEDMLEDLEQFRPKDGAPRAYIKEFEYDEN
ncbi:uncharacterized protein RCO7_03497 [Rhynchosporium graminicola]|uniref:Uncharacterized protein n=1 Tax=Rhynchosporium graminicola TaxID=2792576 RepID=A0A1E1LE74_9HELO|nr:uncharacterized protein RCO7_03497 [Rhynchosporium commune]